MPLRSFVVSASLVVIASTALAGSLTSQVNRLEPPVPGNEQSEFYMSMSQQEHLLTAGKYYRSKITSSGRREYNVIAPELWRNSWIYRVKVGDKEINVPALDEVDFDTKGDEEVYFVPINVATCEFRSRGLEERGMVGKAIVG